MTLDQLLQRDLTIQEHNVINALYKQTPDFTQAMQLQLLQARNVVENMVSVSDE